MESKLATYRSLVMQILESYAELENRADDDPDEETTVVFDTERDQYLLHRMGWYGTRRVWDTAVYVRLRDGKIWIEEDWTQDGIATDLLAGGVPRSEIVLAFHHPLIRPMTEFATA